VSESEVHNVPAPSDPDPVQGPAPAEGQTPDVPVTLVAEAPVESGELAPAIPATGPAAAAHPVPAPALFAATGRRKTAVARVRLRSGSGKVVINKRAAEKYFAQLKDRLAIVAPLEATGAAGRWDILVNVEGGGPTGQSGAIRLGVARALSKADPAYAITLRKAGFLTRDAREVERKKYGRRKARRSFQFSKR